MKSIFTILLLSVYSINNYSQTALQQGNNNTQKIDKVETAIANHSKVIIKNSNQTVINTTNPTIVCNIELKASYNPTNSLQVICNGDTLKSEYYIDTYQMKIIIPYLKGKDFASGIAYDYINCPFKFDKQSGTLDFSEVGGLSEGYIRFSLNVPNHEFYGLSLKMTVDKDSDTLKNIFFKYPVSAISTNGQSYNIDDFFLQDMDKGIIVGISGFTFYKGQKLVLTR